MVAGEASGDLLGSHLIAALKTHLPDAVFYGIGGPKMQGQGLDSWWPMDKLSVMGYWDALKHYREIAGIRRQLRRRLLDLKPDIFIGIDAPDFNLGLETDLKSAGVRTMPPVTSCVTICSPSPSMSTARRPAKCSRACLRCAPQNRPPVQR